MTLDEAIKHHEGVASKLFAEQPGYYRRQCAKDHRQLAEWLKELKALKAEHCEDAISREKC